MALRGSSLPPMQVGDFALAPGKPASLDKSVTMRSITMTSPDDGSLAKYLGKAIEADLRAAGKLDPKSDLVIKGLLTDSQVDTGISTGSGSLSAKFSLLKRDRVVFEKDISINATWDSSFVGAEAIPAAINEYSSLFEKLSNRLLTDEGFQAAARGN